MRSTWMTFLSVLGLAVSSGLALAAAASESSTVPASLVHHAMEVTLHPERGWLTVTDTLTVPAAFVKGGEARFTLNAALVLSAASPAARDAGLLQPRGDDRFQGINASAADLDTAGRLRRYRVAVPPGGGTVVLRYEGRFDFGLGEEREQYTRGFRSTAGLLNAAGVYLAGEGGWYPHLDDGLVGFRIRVAAPDGWHVIAPGNGVSRDADGSARWDSHGPVDELTVVGGPLTFYRQSAGAIDAQVYLRAPDDALAAKYLEATAQYLTMYGALVGAYPYTKFAMVENSWETGYGMPSYTLLGPQIIRFPFILTSSYPHEILHNWWGNSVFVDYARGNWCEGLTAYMADFLIQEQRGRGDEYRRDVLQKYASYVREGRDLPLARFRSRHSAATEAVGYGKALMLFHMVRRRIGDDAFRDWAARFYREQRGRKATFDDARATFEAISRQDLSRLFREQVGRTGAASLRVESAAVREVAGGFELTGALRQAQKGAPFQLEVPLVVRTADGAVIDTLRTDGALTPFVVRTPARPLTLDVDPQFDVFRLLDPREIPPSIGQLFGAPRVLAVLPAAASDEERTAWRALVEGWRSESHAPEFTTDAALTALPPDRAVWLLGRDNVLAKRLFVSGADFTLDGERLAVGRESMALAGHSAVLVRRHPRAPERAVGWILADGLAALPGLGRKLPHYGKYSYLGFEGGEPTNVLKGQWSASDSPLRVDLRPPAERGEVLVAWTPPARAALAELPPVFSRAAMLDRIGWLAAPEREGRGVGTRGLDAAADWIAEEFRKAGLAPGGENGTWFQSFPSTRTPTGASVTLRNVIGVLRGSDPALAGQAALLTAHYDHLGLGWPDVHAGDEGKVHLGADDNASGVAVMLELAKSLAAGERPKRTIVFVAFTGEESGLQGSRWYVDHPFAPLEKTIGVINLDTVGRLRGNRVSVIATGTATEWQHIFRGAGFVTGVEPRLIAEPLESSDQKSFIERGVPAVQIFTEPHPDYHRPGDTPDRIDGDGLVKVAAFVREGIQYLGERAAPLTVTIQGPGASPGAGGAAPGAGAPAGGAPGGGRRVTIGTMPDFAFAGPGVKVASVTPGSPAEQAGLKEGDVLTGLDGLPIADLRGYSAMLRELTPGQTVKLTLMRGEVQQTLEVKVVER